MATAERQPKVPTDLIERTHDEVPDVPDAWEPIADRTDRPFNARAAWAHRETGQIVTVEQNRRPTQMHTPETSTDDVGFNARVCLEDTTGRRDLSPELGSKDVAWHTALAFMAKYPDGEYDIPEPDTWEYGEPAEW